MGATQDLIFKLYGHDESASKALKNVGKEAEGVGGKLKHIGKMGAAGFAAVGAAALAFAEEGVRSAIKVEKQQKQLDIAIKNNTKATKEQTKGANEYLEKLRATYGISNEKLIPAYARLVRATGNLGESQKLLNLAMNISSATGKDLNTVSMALGKAYDGNLGALTRLGVPLDKSIIKHKDFKAAVDVLSKTFNGSAKAATETFSGKLAIIQQNLDIAKEKIGIALMPILNNFAKWFLTVIPNIQGFVDGLTGKDGVADAANNTAKGFHDFGEKIRDVVKFIVDHKNVFENLAKVIAAIFIGAKAGQAVGLMVTALSTLGRAFFGVEAAAGMAAGAEAAATGGTSLVAALPAIGSIAAVFGLSALEGMYSSNGKMTPKQIESYFGDTGTASVTTTKYTPTNQPDISYGHATGTYDSPMGYEVWWDKTKKKWYTIDLAGKKDYTATQTGNRDHTTGKVVTTGHASGGAVAAGTQIMVGENGPELFTPTSGGTITPHNLVGGSGMNVHIHVAGSVIHEKDLAVTVRDNIAQLMRRRGLNPAILGV